MARAFIRTVPNQHRAVRSDDPGLQALSPTHEMTAVALNGGSAAGGAISRPCGHPVVHLSSDGWGFHQNSAEPAPGGVQR